MRIFCIFFLLLLSSCTDHSIKSYSGEEPKINLREFFNGDIYALGIVQDRSGHVIKRFKVDIKASWKGDKAILDEKFVYSDGTKSERIWELEEVGIAKYEGRAKDVIGIANGETAGNVFYFVYDLDLPVGDTTYKVNFEDWMYLLDKDTLLARSYMNKWGFDLGEVTIVMNKKGRI
ncbi:MAG: hypothetical protein CL918_07835 [Deltaproteobacteria bacterium]|jgi:hypothetical protein|nr:hypothetical protein [Deltaproteobacteria bacterium]|tara:strand:- start:910 stop:1437 length:528 start_codon:yes stop_codon:yes gene_type:complete